jgi:hypothetical protein
MRLAGARFWVIGVNAPAVVTGMYLIDAGNFDKGYGSQKKLIIISNGVMHLLGVRRTASCARIAD